MTPEQLVERARAVRHRAHAPYSQYLVAAAALGEDGNVYAGVNVENASYGLTVCAERVAIFTMVVNNCTKVLELAVVTDDGGMPCGACRQVMHEFGPHMVVHVAGPDGPHRTVALPDLLPSPF